MLLRISELSKGQVGTISKIEEGHFAIQLMEMGFIIGKTVKVDHIAPLGDPIALNIAGYVLSIRKADAAQIWVDLKS